jgi:hypothetical protein
MAHIDARIEQSATNLERSYSGMWWSPKDPSRKVPGTLRVDAAGSAKLEVTGKLLDMDDSAADRVVLGDVFEPHGGITLCDAAVVNERRRGDITVQEIFGIDVLAGAKFAEGADSRFIQVNFESVALAPWINEPRPDLQNADDDPLLYQVSLRVPEAQHCSIEGIGALSLTWHESSTFGVSGASVTVRPVLRVTLSEPMSLETIWEKVVTPLLFFTTFVTGQGDSILSLQVLSDQNARPEDYYDGDSAEWIGGTWRTRSGEQRPTVNWWDQLVQYKEVEAQFDVVLPAWFQMFNRAQSSLLDLFAVPITRNLFVEEQFIRVVRAMESWHRETTGGTYMDDRKFSELLDRLIRVGESREERQFIKMRLTYANESTLKQRLDALVEEAGSPLSALVASYTKFSRRVTDTRNSLAHHGSLGEAFDDRGLLCAQKTLELVMRAVLLRRLGFDDDAVSTAVLRTGDWKWWLGTPDNPLVS